MKKRTLYDVYLDLQREQPDKIERVVRKMIGEAINEAPIHRREKLRALHKQIDAKVAFEDRIPILEQFMAREIKRFINAVPLEHQAKLRGLQWKIDNELRHYKDPIARMNRMVKFLFQDLARLEEDKISGIRAIYDKEPMTPPEAIVLPFKPKAK